MAPGFALALLALSLVVTLSAARMFARRLDRLGVAFGLPEALVGLLTALAADGPEIASALIALAKGEHGVGVGVVVGSNTFNLAAMIGLSALLSGAVTLRRSALLLEGAMAIAATLLATAVLLGVLAPALGMILLVCCGVPYLLALIDPRLLASSKLVLRLLPAGLRGAPAAAAKGDPLERQRERVGDQEPPATETLASERHLHLASWMLGDLLLILAGSFGMVQAAGSLGGHWGISGAIVGVLVLAPLTSIPNAVTGVRLGLAGRGSALVSEALNSNTINLAGGIMLPALLVTIGISSLRGHIELWWLVGMTTVCLLALARPRGAGRGTGILLLALYGGFVAVQLSTG